jgi:prevent-host-death family protein
MRRMSARDAKNGFGRLIDLARAEPVAIEKHGRAVVVVIAFEEYERLAPNEGREHEPPRGERRTPKGEQ